MTNLKTALNAPPPVRATGRIINGRTGQNGWSAVMSEELVLRWLGTAGFEIRWVGRVVLIDPYLTRNPRARPALDVRPGDLSAAEHILLSHGHFDHAYDVPAIVETSGADVYCSSKVAGAVRARGVPGKKLHPLDGGESLDLDGIKVRATPTRHIIFDPKLVLKTMPRVIPERKTFREFNRMAAGPVMVYTLSIGPTTVLHMGSLGMKPDRVDTLGLESPDILLVPLQGHTNICSRAALLTAALHPRVVVPQHHDDFFPPLSQMIDLAPFRRRLEELLPECGYYEPEIGKEFSAAQLLA